MNCSVSSNCAYQNFTNVVIFELTQRIEEILLDVVLERVLYASHLTQRLAQIDETTAELRLVA